MKSLFTPIRKLYLSQLFWVEHTVVNVEDGQKTYFHPGAKRYVPYISGQKIKREIMESMIGYLGTGFSPVTFRWNKPSTLGATATEREAIHTADPRFADQLIGGYMNANAGHANGILKRRSPLSISAAVPIHPSLVTLSNENLTFDRSDKPWLHKAEIFEKSGREHAQLSPEKANEFFRASGQSPFRKYVRDQKRMTGLFNWKCSINLDRLFTVSSSPFAPEITPGMAGTLKEAGWKEIMTNVGPSLLLPEEDRNRIANTLAASLVGWEFNTNQSRTYCSRPIIATAFNGDAQKISGAIRVEKNNENMHQVKLDHSQAKIFVTPVASQYIGDHDFESQDCQKASERIAAILKNDKS